MRNRDQMTHAAVVEFKQKLDALFAKQQTNTHKIFLIRNKAHPLFEKLQIIWNNSTNSADHELVFPFKVYSELLKEIDQYLNLADFILDTDLKDNLIQLLEDELSTLEEAEWMNNLDIRTAINAVCYAAEFDSISHMAFSKKWFRGHVAGPLENYALWISLTREVQPGYKAIYKDLEEEFYSKIINQLASLTPAKSSYCANINNPDYNQNNNSKKDDLFKTQALLSDLNDLKIKIKTITLTDYNETHQILEDYKNKHYFTSEQEKLFKDLQANLERNKLEKLEAELEVWKLENIKILLLDYFAYCIEKNDPQLFEIGNKLKNFFLDLIRHFINPAREACRLPLYYEVEINSVENELDRGKKELIQSHQEKQERIAKEKMIIQATAASLDQYIENNKDTIDETLSPPLYRSMNTFTPISPSPFDTVVPTDKQVNFLSPKQTDSRVKLPSYFTMGILSAAFGMGMGLVIGVSTGLALSSLLLTIVTVAAISTASALVLKKAVNACIIDNQKYTNELILQDNNPQIASTPKKLRQAFQSVSATLPISVNASCEDLEEFFIPAKVSLFSNSPVSSPKMSDTKNPSPSRFFAFNPLSPLNTPKPFANIQLKRRAVKPLK